MGHCRRADQRPERRRRGGLRVLRAAPQHQRTDDWFVLKLNEEVGELTQAYLARAGQARDKGRMSDELEQEFRSELADVLAQVLLIARRFNVDLAEEVEHKWLVWKPSQ